MRKREKVRLGRCLIVILDFIRIVVLKLVHHPRSSTSPTFKITLLHVVGTVSFPASVSSLCPSVSFTIYQRHLRFRSFYKPRLRNLICFFSNVLMRHRSSRHPFLFFLVRQFVKLVFLLELWKTSINVHHSSSDDSVSNHPRSRPRCRNIVYFFGGSRACVLH